MGTLKEDRYSSGSVIMIVVAAVGLFCAFIMIVCLLAMSRRRVRTQDRFSSINRDLTIPRRTPPPRFSTLPLPRTTPIMPVLPSTAPVFQVPIDPKYDFRPPSYEEALRMDNNTDVARFSATLDVRNGRSHSPPPAFSDTDPLPRASLSAPACNELVNQRMPTSSEHH